MYRDNGHFLSGGGVAMMLGMLGIWVLIAVAIIWVVLSSRAHSVSPAATHGDGVTRTAEQILAERLAHGEIDPAEYEARLTALRASRRRP
jgi:putative membrane protein